MQPSPAQIMKAPMTLAMIFYNQLAGQRTANINDMRTNKFENHQNMNDALKAQVVDTMDDTYINELRNKCTGYLRLSTCDLFDHLLNRYGKITPADIADCKRRINEALDSTPPIHVYFQTIDECIQYVADGQVAFTANQILQTAYHAIGTSGFYNDACKEWRKKTTAKKTWPLFKRFFERTTKGQHLSKKLPRGQCRSQHHGRIGAPRIYSHHRSGYCHTTHNQCTRTHRCQQATH
jgi:hypothetical protein